MSDTSQPYPRVLVLAQNKIQTFTGGGVVLSNLFGEFPKDHVLFLHRDQEYGVETGFQEHGITVRWLRPQLGAMFVQLARWIKEGLRSPKALLRPKELLRVHVQSCRYSPPSTVDKAIRDFAPDILYAWVGDRLWAETVRGVAQRYELPYVIHFMDNHIGLEPTSVLERTLYPGFSHSLMQVCKQAQSLFGISDSMGQAYSDLWGRPYEVYHGVIESDQWPWPNPKTTEHDVFRLGFTGSVEGGQLKGLGDVAEVLDALNKEEGVLPEVRLVLFLTDAYAQRVKPALADYDCVDICPHPPFSGLRAALADIDALLLTYGLDERTIRYYRYSFATKIVPYMLSGRPIVVHGPEEIAPVRYACDGDWALTATAAGEVLGEEAASEAAKQSLRAVVCRLMEDESLREQLAEKAWHTGRDEHDQGSNANRFRASLLHHSSTSSQQT